MTPKEMLAQFRRLARDALNPPRWDDATLLVYLNEGRTEAARRARLLEDADTGEVCRIAVKASQHTYPIDARVLAIRRVKLASQARALPKISVPDLDLGYPGWQDVTAGDVRAWAPWGDHKLRLIDPPDADDTLNLIVLREPLEDLTLDSGEDDVELPRRVHPRLVDWMMFRAYSERDDEKYRPDEARDRLAMFEAEFGPAMSSALELWQQRKHGYDEFEGLQ